MGRLAKLLSFVRTIRNGANVSDVKVDPGGGPNITAEHFASPGDDSFPLPGDFVSMSTVPGEGRESITGYLDPLNTPVAQPGDKRIYARDVSGTAIVEVWLKSDGTALISNANGSVTLRPDGGSIIESPVASFDVSASGSIKGNNSAGVFELQTGGNFVINGAIIDINGRFTDGDGLVFKTHIHDQPADSNGDVEADTNGPKNP